MTIIAIITTCTGSTGLYDVHSLTSRKRQSVRDSDADETLRDLTMNCYAHKSISSTKGTLLSSNLEAASSVLAGQYDNMHQALAPVDFGSKLCMTLIQHFDWSSETHGQDVEGSNIHILPGCPLFYCLLLQSVVRPWHGWSVIPSIPDMDRHS